MNAEVISRNENDYITKAKQIKIIDGGLAKLI
jgi:hypothetical protein